MAIKSFIILAPAPSLTLKSGVFNLSFDILATVLATFSKIGRIFFQSSKGYLSAHLPISPSIIVQLTGQNLGIVFSSRSSYV
jgi:hypothetical protein